MSEGGPHISRRAFLKGMASAIAVTSGDKHLQLGEAYADSSKQAEVLDRQRWEGGVGDMRRAATELEHEVLRVFIHPATPGKAIWTEPQSGEHTIYQDEEGLAENIAEKFDGKESLTILVAHSHPKKIIPEAYNISLGPSDPDIGVILDDVLGQQLRETYGRDARVRHAVFDSIGVWYSEKLSDQEVFKTYPDLRAEASEYNHQEELLNGRITEKTRHLKNIVGGELEQLTLEDKRAVYKLLGLDGGESLFTIVRALARTGNADIAQTILAKQDYRVLEELTLAERELNELRLYVNKSGEFDALRKEWEKHVTGMNFNWQAILQSSEYQALVRAYARECVKVRFVPYEQVLKEPVPQ